MQVAGFEGPLASPPGKQGNRTSQKKLLLHLVSRTALVLIRSGRSSTMPLLLYRRGRAERPHCIGQRNPPYLLHTATASSLTVTVVVSTFLNLSLSTRMRVSHFLLLNRSLSMVLRVFTTSGGRKIQNSIIYCTTDGLLASGE